jgi:hypothetical protein
MLIGNANDFKRILDKYNSLRYPSPEEIKFNEIRSEYAGLLGGTGYEQSFQPTTEPQQQISFSYDPITGRTQSFIPKYEIPRFETIYDIDPEETVEEETKNETAGLLNEGRTGSFRDRQLAGNQRIVNQFVGDRLFRVNPSGLVSTVDPNSFDYKLNRIANTAMSYSPFNTIKSFLGEEQKVDPRIQDFIEQGQSRKGGVAAGNFREDRRTGDASTAGGTGGRRPGAGPN